MKKLGLLLAVISFTAVSVSAAEPLLLEPLSPTVLSTPYGVNQQAGTSAGPQVTVEGQTGVYEATYTPKFGENMVPQNAAAEGKPVPEKRMPRVKVETKQGRRTNAQWNPGGKGTKSFF